MSPGSLQLESAAAELYAADPDGFIARRTELARAARLAGDRSLAAAIGKLRKPTRSAWLINLYARSASDELNELLEFGAALRTAQEQLSAADLRRLSGQRNTILAAATRRAVALAEARGYRASEAVQQEVNQTLQAALADPAVADQVRAGAVTEAHTYGGFGPLALPASAAPGPVSTPDVTADHPAVSEEPVPEESRQQTSAPDEHEQMQAARAREEQVRAEQARADAERRLQAAETALDQAVDRADEVAEQVTELAEQIAALRSRLRDIEQAKTQAEQDAADAQSAVAELQARVREAREAYDSL